VNSPTLKTPSLAELSPLETLELPGLGSLDCKGLTLIVGPNSSGKSQLLRDIHSRVSGEPRRLVVAAKIGIRKLPLDPLVECLVAEGYIYRWDDENGTPHIRPRTTYVGTGQASQQVAKNQVQAWHSSHNPAPDSRRRDEYLAYLGRFLITTLFLETRLTALGQTGLIDFENNPPQHDLHALYLNDEAKAALLAEMRATFARTVWPDMSRGNAMSLRVSDHADLPSAEDRLSATKMSTYRTIETEGDGLKSYAATCVALLLGRRPVCIIDEPEMCLHPPQAYNLGRFIGRFGSSSDTATFAATHSSQVLRGVIQTGRKLQIVRLTRQGSTFEAHLVPSEALQQALLRPTVRAESVLDGIFSQAVVVLEADGDRTVYQAVWETLQDEFRLDIHFSAVNGTGGIADTCTLYKTLRIPVAVIADLDVIGDADRLTRVLNALSCANSSNLAVEAQAIISAVKQLPPTITPDDVRIQIGQAIPPDLDWAKEHDARLRKILQRIARQLDRMRRLKGVEGEPLPEAIREQLDSLIVKLHAAGLFVVPRGELESWLPDEGMTTSKENKWAWANEAASLVRAKGPKNGDVWDFMRTIGKQLSSRLTTTA
jgi:hypothetical protein